VTRAFERVKCPGCAKVIAAYISHFGDVGELRLVPHNRSRKGATLKVPCPASARTIVRAHGGWTVAP
jgi:ribosomal protein S27E